MASTSFSLGEYWTNFIAEQVESGRYESASAVVRDALRLAEERGKLDTMHSALALKALSGSDPSILLTESLIASIKADALASDDLAA